MLMKRHLGKKGLSPCGGSAEKSKVQEKSRRSFTRMDLSTLQAFRQDIYRCFLRAKNALFDTIDALISESQAKSFAELSHSPLSQRNWPRVYDALEYVIIA